jgi:hypothetical protein
MEEDLDAAIKEIHEEPGVTEPVIAVREEMMP